MSGKEVVVILPHLETKVLMQLRDARRDIVFPGCWGFFGGSIDNGESPGDTAKRELFEELGYKPDAIHKLDTDNISDLGNLISHSYYCALTVLPETITLKEGLDLGLFSLEEVMSRELYSKRMERSFPVARTDYIPSTIRKLLKKLEAAKNIASFGRSDPRNL